MNGSTTESRWTRPWSFALLSALLCLLTHGWMASLEFQLDDYEQIYDAADLGRPAVLLGQDSPGQIGLRSRPSFVKYFRPVLHLSFVLDVFLFGADARALHWVNVFWHWLAVFLLFMTLRKLDFGPSPQDAALGALLFLVAPGKMSAVSWVAARGDLLAGVFFLWAVLALLRWRRTRSKWALVGLVTATVSGMLSKEGALVIPVLLALIDLFWIQPRRPSGARRRWGLAIPFLLLAPVYLLIRHWMFGEMANYYAGHVRSFSLPIAGRMLGDFLPAFENALAGEFYRTPGGVLAWLTAAVAFLLLINLVFFVLRKPLRRGKGILFLLLLQLIAMAPSLRFYREAAGFDVSRLFYLPFLLQVPLLVFALAGWRAKFQVRRIAAFALAALLAASWGIATVRQVRSQGTAARTIARIRHDLKAMANIAPEPCGWLVMNVPSDVDHIPLYGTFMSYAFRPLFNNGTGLEVRALLSRELLLREDALYETQVPIRILRWTGSAEDGRLEALTGLLPAPDNRRPTLQSPAPGISFPVPGGFAPRSVKALDIHLDRTPTKDFGLQITFTDEHAGEFTARWNWKVLYGVADRFQAAVHRQWDWVTLGRIVSCRVTTSGEEAPRVDSIRCNGEIPKIEALSPRDVDVPVGGEGPWLIFRDPHAFPWYRVRLFIEPRTLTWTLPRTRFDVRDDGALRIRLDTPGFHPGEIPVYWEDLRPGGRNDLLGALGVTRLPLSWMVEGLRGDESPRALPQGESDVVTFWITR